MVQLKDKPGRETQNYSSRSKEFTLKKTVCGWKIHGIPVRYSSVAPLKNRGKAASSNMIKSSSSSVTPTRKYSLIRLYLACSKAHLLPTFLKWQRTIIASSDVSQQPWSLDGDYFTTGHLYRKGKTYSKL